MHYQFKSCVNVKRCYVNRFFLLLIIQIARGASVIKQYTMSRLFFTILFTYQEQLFSRTYIQIINTTKQTFWIKPNSKIISNIQFKCSFKGNEHVWLNFNFIYRGQLISFFNEVGLLGVNPKPNLNCKKKTISKISETDQQISYIDC